MSIPFQLGQGAQPNELGYTPKNKASRGEIRRFQRRQRRAERRANRFSKTPDTDANAAEAKLKTQQEDAPGGTTAQSISNSKNIKTKDGSLVAQHDETGRRYTPGFTPNSLYWLENVYNKGLAPNGWYGNMLDTHVMALQAQYSTGQNTADILGSGHTLPDPNRNPMFGVDLPHTKRDTFILNNDTSTDYFLHDTLINSPYNTSIAPGLPDNVTAKALGQSLLENFSSTSWENQDPVMHGFEVIIDAISSPLLNGGVEEFLDAFENVSEIQSRRRILYDFKQQFQKLFKTKGTITFRQKEKDLYENEATYSDPNSSSINSYSYQTGQQGSTILRLGKKAYLSHYLYKIDGLHKLNENNAGDAKKYIPSWQKDFISLTFNEDVSGSMAALTHLYKMLYWSRPNQKHIVPENLLRFNCEIVVSEVRNFNRVRNYLKQTEIDKNEANFKLQVLKDNVSRHVYSLRECQFYFDTPSHDDSIDMSSIKTYEGQTVKFDFKYSSLKFEKWISDPRLFGRYVSYHNGAIWKIGTRGAKSIRTQEQTSGSLQGDYSNPKFYNVGKNTLLQDGVTDEIELMNISYRSHGQDMDEIPLLPPLGLEGTNRFVAPDLASVNSEDDPNINPKKAKRKKRRKDAFASAKKTTKKVLVNAAKSTYGAVKREIKAQINIRKQLLEDTISKMKNVLGLSGLETDPRNVYPRPYTPVGMGIFFDVRNELYNFWGEEISGIMANAQNIINPFGQQAIEGIMPNALKKANAPSVWFNPLSAILKKFSSQPSVLIPNSISAITGGQKLVDLLNKNANFKPQDEGDGSKGSYKFFDYQESKVGGNPGFGFSGLGKQSVKADNLLTGILNKNASINKPQDESPIYVPKDANVGFGGAAVPQSSDNVLAQGKLENILNKNANFKPKDEGVENGKLTGTYTNFDSNDVKSGSNWKNSIPRGFGFSGLGKQSEPADKTENILNKKANFKPQDEGVTGGKVSGKYTFFDLQEPKKGTNYGLNVPKGFGFSALGKQSEPADKTENILNKNANFKPQDEGVAGGKLSGTYTNFDPNDVKSGSNWKNSIPRGFGGIAGQSIKSQGSLENILNSFAKFIKPQDEGVAGNKLAGVYKNVDPNDGFGGPYAQSVKQSSTLEDLVKNNTKWPYPVNNKKFP